MTDAILWLSILIVLLLFAVVAWSRYRRHQRRAQARSRAALNRLLAEADEIAQQARRDQAPGDADTPPTSSPPTD